MEQFNSGSASKGTIEKKIRLAECYAILKEFDAADNIVSEAFESAVETLDDMQPLILQLKCLKLHIRMWLQQPYSITAYNGILELLELAEKCALVFGVDHFETISCRQNVARMHLLREEYTEARKYLGPLYENGIENLGPTSPITQTITNDLAICANMQGEYSFAESILHASFPELSKAAAEKLEIDILGLNPRVLQALSILAALFGAKDEDRKSEIIHQRVIDGCMAQNGKKSRILYESVINKGQAIRDQFKYREARIHYKKWLKMCNQNLGPESEESFEMRRRLVELDQQERKWKEVSQSLDIPAVRFDTWLGLPGFTITSVLGIVVIIFMYLIFRFAFVTVLFL